MVGLWHWVSHILQNPWWDDYTQSSILSHLCISFIYMYIYIAFIASPWLGIPHLRGFHQWDGFLYGRQKQLMITRGTPMTKETTAEITEFNNKLVGLKQEIHAGFRYICILLCDMIWYDMIWYYIIYYIYLHGRHTPLENYNDLTVLPTGMMVRIRGLIPILALIQVSELLPVII